MKKWLTIWLVTLLLLVEPAIALTKYGVVRVRSGELTIVRDEQESVYVPEDGDVEILVNDVLRMGEDAFAVLNTIEQTDIKMGSNAVFQVRPWKSRKKTGYLRMLYGKMSFNTKILQKRKRFRFKSASAMIGVKGTGADCEVGSSGNTMCTGRSGKTMIQGNLGPSQALTANRMSIVVGNRAASQTIEMEPEGGGGEGDEKSLAKSSPTSRQSTSLSREQEAVNRGVIEQESLDESKQEEVAADDPLEPVTETDDGEEEETDEEFEQDMAESEEGTEVVELETTIPLDIPSVQPEPDTTPEMPDIDVEDEIEDAVQESKNLKARMLLEFDN